MRSKNISFKNNRNVILSGKIDVPLKASPVAYSLFAHCFTCSHNLKAVEEISRALTQKGLAVLRFDFTGLGSSKGEFSDTNFSHNIEDLISAYNFLELEYEAPQLLVGHSLGGAAMLHVARQLSKVKAIATIGAPSSPTHIKHLLSESENDIIEKGEAEVNIGGRPFMIKKHFLDELTTNNSEEIMGKLGKALMIMHSPHDSIVRIINTEEIYKASKHPKTFISLDGADHLLSRQSDAKYTGEMISCWATRYITPNESFEMSPE